MDSIDIYLNNNLIAFTDNSETIEKLKHDDEFLIDYVVRAIRGGFVEFVDPSSDLQNLEIVRVGSNSEWADEEQAEDTSPSSHISVWTSKAKPTEKDLEATELLLQLRGSDKFIKKFDDKKTHKLNLWKAIASIMIKKGFHVDGEKCRQKFSNLSKSYLNFVRHVHTTGEEKKKQPDFYEELHKILGEKDKITLEHTKDTMVVRPARKLQQTVAADDLAIPGPSTRSDMETSTMPEAEEPEEQSVTTEATATTAGTRKNRPEKITKENILNVINDQFRQQTLQQEDHFTKMYGLLQKQTEQRGQLIDLLKELVKPSKSKKRRRSDSDSD